MTANHVGRSKVVFPVVVVRINGYKFRALLDSGASHSYASTTAIDLSVAKVKSIYLSIDLSVAKVKSTSLRQIAMLTGITTRTMQVYNVQVSSLANDFSLNVNLTKIENRELLSLENPRYSTLIQEYEHLKEVHMDDDDPKDSNSSHIWRKRLREDTHRRETTRGSYGGACGRTYKIRLGYDVTGRGTRKNGWLLGC
jgi:hypothetical protein